MYEAYATQAEVNGWIALLVIAGVALVGAFVASKINPAYIEYRKQMREEKRRDEKRREEDWWE